MPCGHYMHTYAPRSLPPCHCSLHDMPAVLSVAAAAALTHRLPTAAHFIGLHCILRTVYFAAQRRLFIEDRARVLWRSVGLSVCLSAGDAVVERLLWLQGVHSAMARAAQLVPVLPLRAADRRP
jgi:hypothetical protein